MSFLKRVEAFVQDVRPDSSNEGASVVLAKKLTYQQRKNLPDHVFVFPKQRKYPIPNISHARNALTRASQSKNPTVKKKVYQEVYRRYPELRKPGSKLVKTVKKTRGSKDAVKKTVNKAKRVNATWHGATRKGVRDRKDRL